MYEREKQLTVGGAKDAVQGMMTRRRFVGLGLAAGICCGAGGAPGLGDNRAVRFGIISDTHVTGEASIPELVRAFVFLREKGVDAVIHCGDMTDFGYVHQLEAFAAAWKQAMPPSVPLIPVLGNRDVSQTKRMPQAQREADREKLILSDPTGHARRILGLELGDGMRVTHVRGVPVVAADWAHEGELERFMAAHEGLSDPSHPFVHVQHPHPAGVFNGVASPDAATCWLNMFPKAVSVSGHSHRPYSDSRSYHAGAFTFVAAGSHYLSGGPQQHGIREVAVLALDGESAHIDRYRLHDGSHDAITRTFERKRLPARNADPSAFVFATWNIGGFTHGFGRSEAAARPARAAALRRQLAALDADIIGLAEFNPEFHMGDETAADVFAGYRNAAVGPRLGANCNAVFARTFPISDARHVAYAERQQQRYFLTCQSVIGGAPVTLVQTHLDLSGDFRARQIAHLVEAFGALPRVIVAGDFNVSSPEEFAPLAAAGFKMANTAAFGSFRTHRRRDACYTTAIDNVLARGFDFLDAWTDDDPMLLSDHRILLCRLKPQPAEGRRKQA